MPNVYLNLPAPAGNGAGAWVDVSAMGFEKTIVVGNLPSAAVVIEMSNEAVAANAAPLAVIPNAGKKLIGCAALWMRARVSGYQGGGAPDVNVGANDDGAAGVNLPVTAGNGTGAAVDVSAFGERRTIVVNGAFSGSVLIEASEDNVDWAPFQLFNGPQERSIQFSAQWLRVTRKGVNGGSLPIVNMAAITADTPVVDGLINTGFLVESSAITTPALAAGETVLLVPASRSRILIIDALGTWFLDSITASEVGEVLTVINGSAFTGTLGHEEVAAYGGAVAANCFNCPDALPYVLRSGARVDLRYGPYNDAGVNRWNVVGVNFFAPGGRLCPPTYVEFLERTAFTPTQLWACDEMGLGSAEPLREVSNQNLAVLNAPLADWRMSGYRGVQVTEGGNGWRSDVADPGLDSILIGAFFGNGALASDNIMAGRIDTTAAARRAYLGVAVATGQPTAYFLGAAGPLCAPSPVKVVTDSVVRLFQGNLNRVTDIANSRISNRGEAPVQSADVDASAVTTISGGVTPFNVVGATALTGSVVETFVGGVFQIYGVGAEGARIMAKISHRLGME